MKQLNRNIVLLTVILYSINAYSQHDHGSHGSAHATHIEQPPHGGIIKEVGKYKIEMVAELFLKKDQLRFYLFKGNFKTVLNEGITGTLTFKDSEGKTTTQTLQAKGDDFFAAQLNKLDSFQVIVKFNIKGKTISSVFAINGYGNNDKEKKKQDAHKGHQH